MPVYYFMVTFISNMDYQDVLENSFAVMHPQVGTHDI